MDNDNQLASKLHQFIYLLLKNCEELSPIPTEYLLFKEPAAANPYWIILLFFDKKENLDIALQNGNCYKIHQYFWAKLNSVEVLRPLSKIIFFETGTIPKIEEEMTPIFEKAIQKLRLTTTRSTDKDICNICKHPFEIHQTRGEPDINLARPTQGWLCCTEEGCECFRTWSNEAD